MGGGGEVLDTNYGMRQVPMTCLCRAARSQPRHADSSGGGLLLCQLLQQQLWILDHGKTGAVASQGGHAFCHACQTCFNPKAIRGCGLFALIPRGSYLPYSCRDWEHIYIAAVKFIKSIESLQRWEETGTSTLGKIWQKNRLCNISVLLFMYCLFI